MDAISKVLILITIVITVCMIPYYFNKESSDKHYFMMKEYFPPLFRFINKNAYLLIIKLTIMLTLLFLSIAFIFGCRISRRIPRIPDGIPGTQCSITKSLIINWTCTAK